MKFKRYMALFLSLLLCLLSLSLLSGCGKGSVTYDNPEAYTQGTLRTEEKIRAIEIYWDGEAVRMSSTLTTQFSLEDDYPAKDTLSLHHSLVDGVLRVYPCASGEDASSLSKTLLLQIPVRQAYEFESIKVVAKNDTKVVMNGIGAKTLTVEAEDGDVSFDGVLKTASVTTQNGNLTAKSIGADRLDFTSSHGNANLYLHLQGFTAVMREGKGSFESSYSPYQNADIYTYGTQETTLLFLTKGKVTLNDKDVAS